MIDLSNSMAVGAWDGDTLQRTVTEPDSCREVDHVAKPKGSDIIVSQHQATRTASAPLYQLKAEFFKTLAHPTRIRILEVLAGGEHSVGDMLPIIGVESSNLSQQLGVLRRAGVVVARKHGNAVIYSMASDDMAELMAIARKILTGLLNDQVGLLKDLQESSRAATGAGS